MESLEKRNGERDNLPECQWVTGLRPQGFMDWLAEDRGHYVQEVRTGRQLDQN